MALATLCSQMKQSRVQGPAALGSIVLHAFIVDHRARPESTEEAKRVETWLRQHLGVLRRLCIWYWGLAYLEYKLSILPESSPCNGHMALIRRVCPISKQKRDVCAIKL